MNMQNIAQRARELLVRGRQRHAPVRPAARDSRPRSTSSIDGDQAGGRTRSTPASTCSRGTATTTTPVPDRGRRHLQRQHRDDLPRDRPGHDDSGQHATSRRLLGNGQAAADGKLLNTLRDISQHLRGGTTADAERAADDRPPEPRHEPRHAVHAPGERRARRENRLQLATRGSSDLQSSTTKLLSLTQDVDFAKAATDYSTEQASYTAALRASANIVQSSLLDFLK